MENETFIFEISKIALCIAGVVGILVVACFFIHSIVYAKKLKRKFNKTDIGDIYIRKSDINNPFPDKKRYVYITRKGVSQNGDMRVEYKSLMSGFTDDLEWGLFDQWYVRSEKTVEEIRQTFIRN